MMLDTGHTNMISDYPRLLRIRLAELEDCAPKLGWHGDIVRVLNINTFSKAGYGELCQLQVVQNPVPWFGPEGYNIAKWWYQKKLVPEEVVLAIDRLNNTKGTSSWKGRGLPLSQELWDLL
jgi:hypothetical protein